APAATVNHDRLHANEPQQRDVARESGLENGIGHRVTAEANHQRLAVVGADVRQRFGEDACFGIGDGRWHLECAPVRNVTPSRLAPSKVRPGWRCRRSVAIVQADDRLRSKRSSTHRVMTIDWASFTPASALIGGAIIGVAVALLVLVNGRIAGISGIVGGLLHPAPGEVAWRLAFVLGLIVAPLLFIAAGMAPVGVIDTDYAT